jgi:hypothetical protein
MKIDAGWCVTKRCDTIPTAKIDEVHILGCVRVCRLLCGHSDLLDVVIHGLHEQAECE